MPWELYSLCLSQSLARERPIGSKAPVRTNTRPAIINEQTAMRALCPNPENSCIVDNMYPLYSEGNSSNQMANDAITNRPDVSKGIC